VAIIRLRFGLNFKNIPLALIPKLSSNYLRLSVFICLTSAVFVFLTADERGLTQMKFGMVNLFVLIAAILELKQVALLFGKPRNNTLSKQLCKPSDWKVHR